MKTFTSVSLLVAFVVIAAAYPVEDGSEHSIQLQMMNLDWPVGKHLESQSDTTLDAQATLNSHLREKREPRKRRGQASVDIQHNHRMGTDVNAQVQSNLWQSRNGRSNLDGNANFQQHFGGPGGRQRPNYGAGVQFTHRF